MPIYEFECPECKERSEEFAKMSESDAIFVCAACKCAKRRVFSLPHRERQFSGAESVSLTEGFNRNEVGRARQMLPNHQHCIRDDGSVVFANRSEQRSFVAAQEKAFSSLTN